MTVPISEKVSERNSFHWKSGSYEEDIAFCPLCQTKEIKKKCIVNSPLTWQVIVQGQHWSTIQLGFDKCHILVGYQMWWCGMICLVNGGPMRRGKVASLEVATCPSSEVSSMRSAKNFVAHQGVKHGTCTEQPQHISITPPHYNLTVMFTAPISSLM